MKNRRGVLHGIRIFQADFREDPAMFKRGRKMKRLNVLLLSGAMLLTTAAVTGVTAPKTASVGDLIVTGEAEGNRDYAKVKRAATTESGLTADDYLSEVKAQVTDETDGKRDIRFVAAVKGSYRTEEDGVHAFVPGNYGFNVKINDTTEKVQVTSYYNSMSAGTETYVNGLSTVTSDKTIDDFAGKSGYTFFIALTIKGIPAASNDALLSVTPYVELDAETTVEGTKKVTNVTSTASGTTITDYYSMTLGGKTYLMGDATSELSEEDSAVAQWKVGGLNVTEGDVIQLALNDTELTQAYYEPLDGNNNLSYNSESHAISVKQTRDDVSVYLKLYGDGGYSVWVTGYETPVDVYTMTIGTTTYTLTENADADMTDGRLAEYMVTGIESVTAGEEVKFYKNGVQLTETVNFDSKCNLVEVEDTGVATIHNDATDVGVYFKLYSDMYDASKIWYVGYMTGYETDVDPDVYTYTYYLKPNSNWLADNARFAAYMFVDGGSENVWFDLADSDSDGIYELNATSEIAYTTIIFCRMRPNATENNWNNKWNQTNDLVLADAGENNLYTVADGTWDKGGGTWSVFSK